MTLAPLVLRLFQVTQVQGLQSNCGSSWVSAAHPESVLMDPLALRALRSAIPQLWVKRLLLGAPPPCGGEDPRLGAKAHLPVVEQALPAQWQIFQRRACMPQQACSGR